MIELVGQLTLHSEQQIVRKMFSFKNTSRIENQNMFWNQHHRLVAFLNIRGKNSRVVFSSDSCFLHHLACTIIRKMQ